MFKATYGTEKAPRVLKMAFRLKHEADMLRALQGVPGVPTLEEHGQLSDGMDYGMDYGMEYLLTIPCGAHPTNDLSPHIIVLIFLHVAETIKTASDVCKILHKDVSIGNVVFTVDDKGSVRGHLIDWGVAGQEGQNLQASQITGTYKFMSLRLSEVASQPNPAFSGTHTISDDMESLFYVLLCCASSTLLVAVVLVCFRRSQSSSSCFWLVFFLLLVGLSVVFSFRSMCSLIALDFLRVFHFESCHPNGCEVSIFLSSNVADMPFPSLSFFVYSPPIDIVVSPAVQTNFFRCHFFFSSFVFSFPLFCFFLSFCQMAS